MSYKIGVVGATGMVGEAFLQLLSARRFPVKELRLFASDNSLGKTLFFGDRDWPVQTLEEGCFSGLDLVFFSSGDDISKTWAPKAVEQGAFAVDNSAAFRMHPEHPLVVPEVNAQQLPPRNQPSLIANPNCSTIQLVVALSPLKQKFGLKDVRVASYQAVSGAGKAGRDELMDQLQCYLTAQEIPPPATFAHPIAFNCIPHIGSFNDQGFCSEEVKIMQESRKILGLPDLKISAFTVRVPALNSHSEAVWVTLDKEASPEEFFACLEAAPGLKVIRQERPEMYPHALMASGQEPVYVGRIHRDPSDSKTWLLWVVADNLYKGAALNGLQIAERIFDIQQKS